MRAAHAAMAALFVLAAVVQLNDPDPLRWIAVYAAAAVLSGMAAASRTAAPRTGAPYDSLRRAGLYGPPATSPRTRLPLSLRALAAALAVIAGVWAAVIVLWGPASGDYLRMFHAWKMASVSIEEAREAIGLLIVAAWMTFLCTWR